MFKTLASILIIASLAASAQSIHSKPHGIAQHAQDSYVSPDEPGWFYLSKPDLQAEGAMPFWHSNGSVWTVHHSRLFIEPTVADTWDRLSAPYLSSGYDNLASIVSGARHWDLRIIGDRYSCGVVGAAYAGGQTYCVLPADEGSKGFMVTVTVTELQEHNFPVK